MKIVREKVSTERLVSYSVFGVVFLVCCYSTMAGVHGVDLSIFDRYLEIFIRIFRYIAAVAILGAIFAAYTGRASWGIAVTIIVGALVVANLETILTVLGFVKGMTM